MAGLAVESGGKKRPLSDEDAGSMTEACCAGSEVCVQAGFLAQL